MENIPVNSNSLIALPVLDGLRGLAVLLVVLSHLGNAGIDLLPFVSFAGTGKAGVYLFFVLSAFLLTRQTVQACSGTGGFAGWPYWAAYLLRRVLRIFPLYLVILTMALAGGRLGYVYIIELSPQQWFRHLLLQEGQSVFWTIPVEFTYYLVLPLVAFATLALRRFAAWLPLVGVMLALVLVQFVWPAGRSETNSIALVWYLPVFLSGSLAALLSLSLMPSQNLVEKPSWQMAGKVAQTLLFLFLSLTIPSLWRVLSGGALADDYFHRDFMLYGVLWSLVVLMAVHLHAWESFFASRAMRLLGRISFSVYLTHMPVVMFFADTELPVLPCFILVMVLAVAVGYCSYRLIEVPAMNLGKRWSQRLLATQGRETASSLQERKNQK